MKSLLLQPFKFLQPFRHQKERKYYKKITQKMKMRVNIVLNNKEATTHDTTNTCSCDCGARATVPSETTVSRESTHDSKQLCNSWCSERCCTARSRRRNNYQIQ